MINSGTERRKASKVRAANRITGCGEIFGAASRPSGSEISTAKAVPAMDMASVSRRGSSQSRQREKSGGTISEKSCPSAGIPSAKRCGSKNPVSASAPHAMIRITPTKLKRLTSTTRSACRMVSWAAFIRASAINRVQAGGLSHAIRYRLHHLSARSPQRGSCAVPRHHVGPGRRNELPPSKPQ